VKAGWIVASTVDGAAAVIRHLPAGLEPGGWASPGPKRLDGNPKRKPSATSRYATNERAPQRSGSLRNAASRAANVRSGLLPPESVGVSGVRSFSGALWQT
jgi:hypothetical protein